MNTDADFSFLDLLELPELENEIFIYITRNGPTDTCTLAQAIERDPVEVCGAIAVLIEAGHIRLLPDGQADAVMGRVKSWTTFVLSSKGL